jgi:hypothetical protein
MINLMFEKTLTSLKVRLSVLGSFYRFLIENKKWWLIPMISLLLVFFLIMIFAQGSPLGPFIYAIF